MAKRTSLQTLRVEIDYTELNATATAKRGKTLLVNDIPEIVNTFIPAANPGIELSKLAAKSNVQITVKCPSCQQPVSRSVNNTWRKQADGTVELIPCHKCANQLAGARKSIKVEEACPEALQWFPKEGNPVVDLHKLTVGNSQRYNLQCPVCGTKYYRSMKWLVNKQPDGAYKVVTCQVCSPTKPKNVKYLSDVVPDIGKQWDRKANGDKSPDAISATSSTQVWTYCPVCGTSVLRTARFTWQKGDDGIGHVIHCRTCGKRNSQNALVARCPEIKAWWAEENDHPPDYYTCNSGKWIYLRCPSCDGPIHRPVCEALTPAPDGKYAVKLCADCSNLERTNIRRHQGSNLRACCPDIDNYWDFSRNTLRPEDLSRGANVMIDLFCPDCGKPLHRRAAYSFSRPVDGICHVKPCHHCRTKTAAQEMAMARNGPLITECPEIEEWWVPDHNTRKLEDLTRGAHYVAHLQCPACKHAFERDIHSVIAMRRDGRLLPVACTECGYSSVGDPVDNLVTACPEIADWWDYAQNAPLRPEQFTRGSQMPVHLRCPDCQLELYTGIHSLVYVRDDGSVGIRHDGRCRKLRAQANPNNLLKVYPAITALWDYEANGTNNPEDYTIYSPQKAHFRCPDCGSKTYTRISDACRTVDGIPQIMRCAYCTGRKPIPGVSSLAAEHPDLMGEWDTTANIMAGIDPDCILDNDSSTAWWRCPDCGNSYPMVIRDRVIRQRREQRACPDCNGRRWHRIFYL